MPGITHKTDASSPQRQIFSSASVLVAILVVLSVASAYMLHRLYLTSSQLAESNRKAFILETRNKKAIIEKFFGQRVSEFARFSRDDVFQAYFATNVLPIPHERAAEIATGQVEQKLLVSRLAMEDRGKPVFSRMAFFDVRKKRIVARTDFSPKGRWIDEAPFEKLVSKAVETVNIGTECSQSVCRIFLFGPVTYKSRKGGILIAELSTATMQDQIQLLTLQKSTYFSGLCDSRGTLLLGPKNLIGNNIQDLFGITTAKLHETLPIETESRFDEDIKPGLMISGGGILGTEFFLVQVAPRSRFVGDHSPLLWALVFTLLMGGLVLVLINIYRSYAERQVMYEKLQDAHDHLEIRVKERTAELEEVNQKLLLEISERRKAEDALRAAGEELQAANRDLKDFAYVVSHDLKAPLRSVRQLVDWIVKDYEGVLDETGKRYAELLTGRVKLMDNLIEGILRYSRVGRFQEEPREVDLNLLVHEIINVIDPPESMSIRVDDPLPTVMCEPTLLHEVFQNLLDNAVKYMDKPNGEIRIGCARENAHWTFSVADNGPGIDEVYFEKIFEIFRTFSHSDGVESTGIGLALVKKIIERKGGRIWVESEPGRGTKFLFTFPATELQKEG